MSRSAGRLREKNGGIWCEGAFASCKRSGRWYKNPGWMKQMSVSGLPVCQVFRTGYLVRVADRFRLFLPYFTKK
jgi:hypothetical protein